MLSNMFTGVVLQSLTDATQEEQALQYILKASLVKERRGALLEQQQREHQKLLASMETHDTATLDSLLRTLYENGVDDSVV